MQGLITWDGASDYKRHLVTFEMRKGFGRPIRSITVEPFPADARATLAAFGDFKPNIDVTCRIRVVFEPAAPDADPPVDMVFLAGPKAGAYRIALVNPLTPKRHQ